MAAYYWSLMYAEGVRLDRPLRVGSTIYLQGGVGQVRRTLQRWSRRHGTATEETSASDGAPSPSRNTFTMDYGENETTRLEKK